MATFNFTTGPSTLPDVGILSYNTCEFSPLFESQVSGVFVTDAAGRTTKEIEYTITVDGYVTLPDGELNIETTMLRLEELLSAPAGTLIYSGRSLALVVNGPGGLVDVAWGPIPEILEIVTMGAGRSAKIKWTVKTRVPPAVGKSSARLGPVLQFCWDTSVSYDEAGYSSLRISGIVEIPLTRFSPTDRTLDKTVDDFRDKFPGKLLATIDLTRFRVVQRDFRVSKDKRTLEFDVEAQELSWMAMPPDVTLARGQFTFKPAKTGMGLCNWLCTLSCTYTVRKDLPRRIAWLAFLALLRIRMQQGNIHGVAPPPSGPPTPGVGTIVAAALTPGGTVGLVLSTTLTNMARWRQIIRPQPLAPTRKVFLVDFNGGEGLYTEAKTVTFSATWRLVTIFSEILLASGLWKKGTSLAQDRGW